MKIPERVVEVSEPEMQGSHRLYSLAEQFRDTWLWCHVLCYYNSRKGCSDEWGAFYHKFTKQRKSRPAVLQEWSEYMVTRYPDFISLEGLEKLEEFLRNPTLEDLTPYHVMPGFPRPTFPDLVRERALRRMCLLPIRPDHLGIHEKYWDKQLKEVLRKGYITRIEKRKEKVSIGVCPDTFEVMER